MNAIIKFVIFFLNKKVAMKKIFTLLFFVTCSVTMLFAQAKPASDKAKAATAKVKGPTKADGTPDMRFKANKETGKPGAGPTKADGTPDMRFKANKETGKPSKVAVKKAA
jgi:hypothetical protein